MTDLLQKKCTACAAGTKPLDNDLILALLADAPGWELVGKEIAKTYEFKNFHQTMGFVNVVAWIANREDHHPDLEVSYKKCRIRFSTHSIGGLSENDFICAAKIDAVPR